MAIKKQINLIPIEMTVPAKSVNLVKTINKISTVSTLILVVLLLIFVGSFIYLKIESKKTAVSVSTLKAKIIDLEKNEQKLILAKDKISKISYIQSINSVDNEITDFRNFEESLSEASDSSFVEVSIDSDKTESSLAFSNSINLNKALIAVSNLKQYKKVILSSLGFNSNSGYLLNLVFEK